MAARRILHVDMDAFYASVEQRDNPDLKGQPVVVGGTENRGVVAAASYEARKFGIRSAMPTAEALRRCPHLVRIRPRMSHYKSVSRQVFAVFREFTPIVEGLSLDEAFLDVSGCRRLFGTPRDIAVAIKRRIRETTQLTASVGIAENKLVAKIASDLDKPNGLTMVMPDDYPRILDPLPAAVIPGIGKVTLRRLHAVGIRTVRDLRFAEDRVLEPIFGRFTQKTRDRAAGIDAREVVTERGEKSISAEETFDQDLRNPADMERELLSLCERTAARLRKANLAAATVQVKIRSADFSTFTRQQRLTPPGNHTDTIYHLAQALLRRWLSDNDGAAVRLLGVGGSNLSPARQPDLFAADAGNDTAPIDSTVDDIRDRFGAQALGRASTLKRQ